MGSQTILYHLGYVAFQKEVNKTFLLTYPFILQVIIIQRLTNVSVSKVYFYILYHFYVQSLSAYHRLIHGKLV